MCNSPGVTVGDNVTVILVQLKQAMPSEGGMQQEQQQQQQEQEGQQEREGRREGGSSTSQRAVRQPSRPIAVKPGPKRQRRAGQLLRGLGGPFRYVGPGPERFAADWQL